MFKKVWMGAALVSLSAASFAAPVTLITGSTQGLYNAGIGTSLNGSSAAFPTAGDPSLDFATAPNLSAASSSLGNWLSTPTNPGGTWSATAQAIPSGWTVGDETAVIYSFDAGPTGLSVLNLSFGVDNGLFVWLDGAFIGGHMRPGGAALGELQFTLNNVSAGVHHLQLLLEDHGGGTGYLVQVTGDTNERPTPVPAPGTLPLVALALCGLGVRATRRR
jgi:hypothetical protein